VRKIRALSGRRIGQGEERRSAALAVSLSSLSLSHSHTHTHTHTTRSLLPLLSIVTPSPSLPSQIPGDIALVLDPPTLLALLPSPAFSAEDRERVMAVCRCWPGSECVQEEEDEVATGDKGGQGMWEGEAGLFGDC
jgi:hypothetical protein